MKLEWTRLPWPGLDEVVRVMMDGAKKYPGRPSWMNYPEEDHKASLLRHVLEYNAGVEKDAESGLHPLAHAVCRALFILGMRAGVKAWGPKPGTELKVEHPGPMTPSHNPKLECECTICLLIKNRSVIKPCPDGDF